LPGSSVNPPGQLNGEWQAIFGASSSLSTSRLLVRLKLAVEGSFKRAGLAAGSSYRSNRALLGRDVLSGLSGAAVSSSATANAVMSNSASSLAGIGSLAATDPASATSQTPSQGFMPAATLPAALPLTRAVTDWSQPLFTFFDVVGLQWETSDHSDVL
jgi:hypothetical protein